MARKLKFQTPTGMHDILPKDQAYFRKIYNVVENIANFYGFGKIDTPILEQSELFSKGVGLDTDIVQKEMFNLKTRGGDHLSLRPEGTAPVVRAYIQKGMINLPQPVKLWYFGPFFRHEKPQAGRFRQFWQFGLEVLGEKGPVIDAQIIQIFYNILKDLKLKNLLVEINSIGDSQCRPYYKKLLKNYLRSRERLLCADCRRRLKTNPLRILDCKQERCQSIVSQAPESIDNLCDTCHEHFKEVLEFLDEAEISYRLNPYLVRGLDYYTKTVFEIVEDSVEGKALGALVGGGRYDNLSKILGRRDIPGTGGAAGIDRIIASMKETGSTVSRVAPPKIFLSQVGKAKISIIESFGRDSLRAQLAKANKLGVLYTLILGHKEAIDETIIVRDMKTGKQKTVKMDKVVKEMKKNLKK